MKKSTKGAVAAAAAGVLLIGGVGSLAFWSDSITIGSDTINSGHLSLDDTNLGVDPDPAVTTDDGCAKVKWTLDSDEPDSEFDPLTDEIVPGDVLTKVCTFDVSAVGNHLKADLSATGGAVSGADLAPPVTSNAVFTVAGGALTSITEDNDEDELKATITLTFPYGVENNDSQDKSLNLTAYTVTATQVHSN